MTKKYTTIEEQLTEGFWDAIVNKAKRVGLATGAALGSNKSRGKLDANTLATELYNQFKHWQGLMNMPADMSSVGMFLDTQVHMNYDFIQNETGVDVRGQNGGGQGQQQPPQSANQGGKFDDPLKHIQGGGQPAQASGDSDNNNSASNYKPEGDDFKPVTTAINEFMRYGVYGAFKRSRDARGFDKNTSKQFSSAFDGSFIFAPGTSMNGDLEQLLRQAEADGSNVQDIAADMEQKGFFGTWDDFKKTVAGAERIAVNSRDEADLFRQAIVQAVKLYHYNFPKNLNRFVLAHPPATPDKQAAKKEPYINDGDPTVKTVESFDTTGQILTEAGMSDGALRKAFMNIAQHGLRTGQFKMAANNTIQALRGEQVVGNAVHTGGNNGNNNGQQGQQQQSQGSDILAKAIALGHVLGVKINKFTLQEFKEKDGNAYNKFMQNLHEETGSSFSQDFLDYAKKALAPFFDFSQAKPNTNANQNVNGQSEHDSSEATTDGDASAEPAEDGLKFYDIDRRKIAWDAQNDMLIVRSTKNGKTNESTFKRTDDGWVTDRNTVVQEKFVKLIDNWYDRVMANSGGEAAQDTNAAEPAPKDPSVIPTGATVTNPSNQGQYKFNGKTWMAGDGKSIPADSEGAKTLDTLYRKSKGIAEPKQTDAQGETTTDQNAQKAPEQTNGTNTQNQEEKPIPDGATLKNSKVAYTFKNGSWTRPNGDAVPRLNAEDLSKLYRDGKPLPEPQQSTQQQPAQKGNPAPDQQNAAANSTPQQAVGNAAVPTDAKLSHDGNVARKLARGVWWNEKTKKPYPADQTAKIDDLYRRSLAAKDGSAIPPEGSTGAPDGAGFKLGGADQYKKENGQWFNTTKNKPVTDPKTAMHLDTEFKKQQNKKGSVATLTKDSATNDNQAAPIGAKFKQNDRGAEYTRTKDGWVDQNGKLNDNEANVATLDRGYNNAKKNNGIRK
jgi:hypothetical protein